MTRKSRRRGRERYEDINVEVIRRLSAWMKNRMLFCLSDIISDSTFKLINPDFIIRVKTNFITSLHQILTEYGCKLGKK